jgi:hypothetical protein
MSFLSPFRAAGIATSFTNSLLSAVKEVEATIDKAMAVDSSGGGADEESGGNGAGGGGGNGRDRDKHRNITLHTTTLPP